MSAELKKLLEEYGLEYFDKYYGCYKGFVHSNEDPKNMGRLQVSVPVVYGEEPYEEWAPPKGIYAGKSVGSVFLPSKGDQLWVSFENGDSRFPIWEYGGWRKGELPEGANKDLKILQTNSGHKLEFDDKQELIRLTDKHGHILELNKKGVSFVSEDSISIGSLDESAEPAVLGDTAVSLLNEFITDIGNLGTITTSTGVTATISTSPQWDALVQKWQDKWKTFNSTKVTLD